MLIVLTRTLILYSVVVLGMRLMGKRQIAQLEPFELVVAIMIAELAAVPMEDRDIPLLNGLIPLFTLVFLQVLLSVLSQKSLLLRSWIDDCPTVVIRNGIIDEKSLKNVRFTVHEVLEQLRIKGFYNIADIEYAILETNGVLSVLPKSQKRPINAADLGIETNYEGLPLPLIIDGVVIEKNLLAASLDKKWLEDQLAAFDLDARSVLLASLDTQGNLFYQQKARR